MEVVQSSFKISPQMYKILVGFSLCGCYIHLDLVLLAHRLRGHHDLLVTFCCQVVNSKPIPNINI